MESLFYDLRHAARHLLQRPLFALVAIGSIAIGIGANTTLLSVANALLFRPPGGLDDPSRIVEVGRTTGGRGRDTFSYPELLDLRSQTGAAFAGLAGFRPATVSYAVTAGDAERFSGMAVSWNYFAIMGVRAERGRFFLAAEDDLPMANPLAVISDKFWRTHLGAREDVIGRTVEFNRRSFTVIGVTPPAFQAHIIGLAPDVYVPMTMYGALRPGFERIFTSRQSSWLNIVGRLQPGVALGTADAAAKLAFTHMPQPNSDRRNDRSAAVDPIGLIPAVGRTPAAAFLGMLLGLVGIILLVTCANVAGMLLARAAARSREIAIRLALGSSRGRLVRQLLVEALALFMIGGAAGVAMATLAARLLARIPLPTPVPVSIDLGPDWRVLAIGLLAALATGVIFGLVPALQATRQDLAATMKLTAGAAAGREGRLRRVFVMSQVGLSLLLLLSAGLFLRSLQRASTVSTGFDGAGVATASFDLFIDGYDEIRGQVFLRDLLQRLRAQPGVTGAGYINDLPLDMGISGTPAWMPEAPNADHEGWVDAAYAETSDSYFESLRIPVLRGRGFETGDLAASRPVVVVSRTFAAETWPGQDALGKVLHIGGRDAPARTVVGVVEDVKQKTLMETTEPAMYAPVSQDYTPSLNVLVRAASGPAAEAVLRRVLREADPQLSTSAISTLDAITGIGILPQRLAAMITSALGLLALLLSALGVYGVIAFTVAQRTREIGIRMALGAQGADVVRLVLRGGLRLALPGLAFGIVGGLALSIVLRSFLLGLAPADPATFVAIPLLLLGAIALACWAPARRAAAVEPSSALRAE